MPPRVKPVPDSPGDESSDRPQPTPAEAHLFYSLIKNMKSKPDIDWDAVATDNNFKNAETAKVRFGQIKRKLGLQDVFAGAAGGAATPKPPPRARGKKAAAAVAEASSPSTQSPGTPLKTPVKTEGVLGGAGVKKARGRGAKPKIEDFVSEAAYPATPTKPTKRGKKSTPLKTEIKDEDLPISLLDDGDEAMVMDDEESLGHITPAKITDNNDSDVEVTGSAVVKGKAKATATTAHRTSHNSHFEIQEAQVGQIAHSSVPTHPAFSASYFNPYQGRASNGTAPGNGYDGFVPSNTDHSHGNGSGNGNGNGNGYAGFIPSNADHNSGDVNNGNYALTTFGGIRERNPTSDDDDEGTIGGQFPAPPLDIRSHDTGPNDGAGGSDSASGFNFSSMMASNMPGGGSSRPYGIQDLDTEDTGVDYLEGPPDIFQPSPTRPPLFGGSGGADSYFASTSARKPGRARKPPGDGDGDDDAGVI